MNRNPRTTAGWLFWVAILAACILLPEAGCGTICSNLIPGHEKAVLRKKVDADPFPTAEKAGVQ